MFLILFFLGIEYSICDLPGNSFEVPAALKFLNLHVGRFSFAQVGNCMSSYRFHFFFSFFFFLNQAKNAKISPELWFKNRLIPPTSIFFKIKIKNHFGIYVNNNF